MPDMTLVDCVAAVEEATAALDRVMAPSQRLLDSYAKVPHGSHEANPAIAEIESSIGRLDSASDRLTHVRERLSLWRGVLVNATRPATGLLPPEILSEIFSLVVDSTTCADNAVDAALPLTHVTVLWREVALAHSPFWGYIHATWDHKRQDISLERSNGRQLWLLSSKGGTTHFSPRVLEAARRVVHLSIARFRSFTPSTGTHRSLVSQLSALRIIDIQAMPPHAGRSYHFVLEPSVIYHRSIQVVRLVNIGVSYTDLNLHSTPNWMVLSLENGGIPPISFMKLLQMCKRLRNLRVVSLSFPRNLPDLHASLTEAIPLVLSKLTDLWIEVRKESDCSVRFFCQSIKAPNLSSLTIHYSDDIDTQSDSESILSDSDDLDLDAWTSLEDLKPFVSSFRLLAKSETLRL